MAEQTSTEAMNGVRREPARGLEFALLVTALAWVGAAHLLAGRSAEGITVRFKVGELETLVEGVFLLFLLVVGFRMLDWVGTRGRQAGDVLPLPRRPGWPREWGVGVAMGWGLCLAATLPVLVAGHMHSRLSWQPGSGEAIALALGTLLVGTLASEVVYRGYPFRRLMRVVGPSWAAVVLSVVFGVMLVVANPPRHAVMAMVDGTLFGLLLAMAYLRTHALWVGWGMHFAYRAIAAVVLGLPIAGHGEFGSITDTYADGPRWLSGGAFGLDAALLTAMVMLGGMVVLYRATREYAWLYTHAPIVPAGYEVTVAPPAAHVAMEKAAATPPLVQILAVTPVGRTVAESTGGDSTGAPPPPL